MGKLKFPAINLFIKTTQYISRIRHLFVLTKKIRNTVPQGTQTSLRRLHSFSFLLALCIPILFRGMHEVMPFKRQLHKAPYSKKFKKGE